jgi:hypothetical protein
MTPVCGKVRLLEPQLEMSIMIEVRVIGLVLPKNVFQVRGADEEGAVLLKPSCCAPVIS